MNCKLELKDTATFIADEALVDRMLARSTLCRTVVMPLPGHLATLITPQNKTAEFGGFTSSNKRRPYC